MALHETLKLPYSSGPYCLRLDRTLPILVKIEVVEARSFVPTEKDGFVSQGAEGDRVLLKIIEDTLTGRCSRYPTH